MSDPSDSTDPVIELEHTVSLQDEFRPGVVIAGKFTLLRLVAEGGQGSVYEAEDNLIGRRVAIKLLNVSDEHLVWWFKREARALGRIRHPNVVTIHEMGQRRDGSYYIVQELLTGPDLRGVLEEKGKLSVKECAEVLLPISGALLAAHQAGIVHRDVKPDNIMFTQDNAGDLIPKLVDFGVVKSQEGTDPAIRVGTPAYMSPEQFDSPAYVDAASDVWAMGVTIFELLSGERPFDESSLRRTEESVRSGPIVRLDQKVADIPKDIADLVAAALERNKERRIPMDGLRKRLRSLTGRGMTLLDLPTTDSKRPSLLPQAMSESFVFEGFGALPEDLTSLRGPVIPDLDWVDGLPRAKGEAAKHVHDAERAVRRNALDIAVNSAAQAISEATSAAKSDPSAPMTIARMRLVQAIAHRWLGEYTSAERCAQEAMRTFKKGSKAWYTAATQLAIAAASLGKTDQLASIAGDLNALETANLASAHIIAVSALVSGLVRTGQAEQATQMFNTALLKASRYARAEPQVRAWLGAARSELALHDGDIMRFMRYVALSIDMFLEAQDVRAACFQRAGYANAFMQLGGYENAESELREALAIAEPMGLGIVASIRASLGLSLARQRQADEAAEVELLALKHCIRQGYKRLECTVRIYLAIIESLRGDIGSAIEHTESAVVGSGRFPGVQAYALAMLASLLLIKNQAEASLIPAQRAMELLERLGGVEEGEAQIRVVYAHALYENGRREEAMERIALAHSRLSAQAARLSDPRWKQSFLERIPEHARTVRFAAKWTSGPVEGETVS